MNGKKRNWITLWLLLVCAALLITGTYAAFTTVDYIKRVVSTTAGERPRFSSNYLYLVEKTAEAAQYPSRRISAITKKDGCSFTVEIYNYLYGNQAEVNSRDIQYQLEVTLNDSDDTVLTNDAITIDGTSLSAYVPETKTMEGGKATPHSYTFFVPSDAMGQNIIFEIVANPINNASYIATGEKKLAARIRLADIVQSDTWTGEFTDSHGTDTEQRLPQDYDGFNYEIRGDGVGTVTLTWDTSKLEISPWFSADVNGTPHNGVLEFPVNSDTRSGYHLQFYIKNIDSVTSWTELEKLVKVSFESSGSTQTAGAAGTNESEEAAESVG